MDGYVEAAGVVRHGLTETPWPFRDHEFDGIQASHVLEHIPLAYRERGSVLHDRLFDVFDELHRVLKPGGVLHLRVPWAGSHTDASVPQHYRRWLPESFHYLSPEGNQFSPRCWRVERWRRNRSPAVRWAHWLRMGPSGAGLTVHLTTRFPFLRPLLMERGELEVWLRPVAPTLEERAPVVLGVDA